MQRYPQTHQEYGQKYLPITLALSLLLATVFFLTSCSGDNFPQQDQTHKFNVVMIVSDALRQDVLGCYGGEAKTPNIDWLAKQGILFDNAYSTSPWTVPSSVSMLTGNYPSTYSYSSIKAPGANPLQEHSIQIQVPDNEILLVENLVKLKYSTKMKIENPNARLHNNMQGFENLPDYHDFYTAVSSGSQEAIKKIINTDLLNVKSYQQSYLFLEYLRTIPPRENFFALYWVEDPHAPYAPIEKFKSRIVVDEKILSKEKNFYSIVLPDGGKQLSKAEKEYNKKLYLAEVESVDERVGFIIRVLQSRNLLDSTFIIFTSDHGEQFGEHNQYGHGGFGRGCNYYEQLVKVPLIMVGPGLSKNKRIKSPVSHLALTPTIKDLLGVEYPNSMQGKSFYPLMRDRAYTDTPLFFTDVRDNEQVDGMLEDNFKLIALKNGNFKLYDLDTDKAEGIDIAPQRQNLVQSMSKRILAFRESNLQRLQENQQQPSSTRETSPEDKQETINKLRDLGYIK